MVPGGASVTGSTHCSDSSAIRAGRGGAWAHAGTTSPASRMAISLETTPVFIGRLRPRTLRPESLASPRSPRRWPSSAGSHRPARPRGLECEGGRPSEGRCAGPPAASCDGGRSLSCEPGPEAGGLVDVILLELRVLAHDVVRHVAVGEQLEDELNRDAQPANRRPPFADAG